MLTSVIVFGHEFEIELVAGLEDNGDMDIDAKKIRISADLSPDAQWEFLFHELSHAALTLGGISEVIGLPAEEGVCRAIQYGLWPAIRALLAESIDSSKPKTRRRK